MNGPEEPRPDEHMKKANPNPKSQNTDRIKSRYNSQRKKSNYPKTNRIKSITKQNRIKSNSEVNLNKKDKNLIEDQIGRKGIEPESQAA